MGKKNRRKKENYEILNKSEIENSNSKKIINFDNDLFDNPMTRSALSALSKEDKDKYKEIGEHMYGRINYEDGKYFNNMDENMLEAVAYIESQLLSGLHPSMLEDKEKVLLFEAGGNEWYLKWGYIKEDLDNIITVKQK